MKKTYSAPTTQVVKLHLESTMLTGSTKTVNKTSTQVGADVSLSNEQAWGTPIWGSDED